MHLVRSLFLLRVRTDAERLWEQISFAQKAMGNKAAHEQQFGNAAGMIPPSMSLPSAALDPKAAARAEAAAAAGAKQRQLEIAAVASSSNASARAQAAEDAKRQQKRLEAAAEAEAAQQNKLRAQQAALQEESDRKQRLKEAAQEDAKNRQMQLERAAMAQEVSSAHPRAVPSSVGASVQEGVDSHSVPAQSHPAPQVQSVWGQPPVQPKASGGAPEPAANPAGRSIDGRAWPAIKPNPGASVPVPPQNVWGAVPSSILKAPAPAEEKKPAAQQQKAVKTENVLQQKNAWGNVTLGRAAEVKPGTVKNPTAASQSAQKVDAIEAANQVKPPQQDWERGPAGNAVQSQEGGDAEGVERARRMLDDFLKMRGMQQGGQDVDEHDPWSSENIHQVTEDSNDTDEVFFMRPNGVSMLAASGDKPMDIRAPLGWEAGGNSQREAPVKPSAWALGAPRIADKDADEGFGSSFTQGFGQVDCPEGLMAFELSCDGGDAFASADGGAAPATSAWGKPNMQVDTKVEDDGDENGQEDEENKSPSVALKMLLGIGRGGAAVAGAPAAAPPVARKLPVWGKPDGKVDISMDPAIAQIATDMPPPARSAPFQEHAQDGERDESVETNSGVQSSWESKPLAAPAENQLRQQHPREEDSPAPGPQTNPALAQNMQHPPPGGLPQHLGQMATPASFLQPMPQMQGPSAFAQSGPAQEQTGGMSGNMLQMPPMPTPQQLQQMQTHDVLRSLQVPGPDAAQRAPSERPPDSMFPFGMGAGMGESGGGLGSFANMPPMQPAQGMQNAFRMGGLGMMPPNAGPGDNPNLPLWMQPQQQGPPMTMGNRGMLPNAGPPGDNVGLPPWMRQQQGLPMGMGPPGGFGNGLPPGMGMGPMGSGGGPMGPGGGLDLLKMLGGGLTPPDRQDHPGNQFHAVPQTTNMHPDMSVSMGGQGAGEPRAQQGFSFPGQASGAQAGSETGGGGFDFNKVFGGMGSTGPAGMPQLPQMGGPGSMPGAMLSLAGMLPQHVCSRFL